LWKRPSSLQIFLRPCKMCGGRRSL
jgi:hypothetical protein